MKYVYIASAKEDGGIYRYIATEKGLSFVDVFHCPTPMYFVKEGDLLYIVLRAPFEGSEDSGVLCCRIREDGSLEQVGEIASTEGKVGCHIAVSGEDCYVANYVSGSICHIGKKLVTHEGHGSHPTRQSTAHVHSVLLSPDGRFLLSADLGLDRVYVYDRELNEVGYESVPQGHGCRHMVFSHDGQYLYCVNELGNSVSVFSFEDGVLKLLSTQSCLLPGTTVDSIAAAIRLSADGKRLYVTNRGENTIAVFEVNKASVTRRSAYPSGGREPRDFVLFSGEKYAAVADQFSDMVRYYDHREGALTPIFDLSIPAPLCIDEYDI